MAFTHDPMVVGLRPGPQTTSTPRAAFGRNVGPTPPTPPKPPGPARPSEQGTPTPVPGEPGATAEECRVELTNFRVYAAQRERRLQWLAVISGLSGLGVGLALGAWQGSRSAVIELPEGE